MVWIDGWYLAGPLIAVAVVGLLGAVLWRMGLRWDVALPDGPTVTDGRQAGLALFAGDDDYGLLLPATVTDDPATARLVRLRLTDAGIRSTTAVRTDGRWMVLVFTDRLAEARRLVGDSPAL